MARHAARFTILYCCLMLNAAYGLGVGSTREEVVAALGEPTVTARKGPTEMLYYSGGVIDIRDGKVSRMDPGFREIITKRAQGLVKYDGKWITTGEVARLDAAKAAGLAQLRAQAKPAPAGRPISDITAPPVDKISVVANGGNRVEIPDLLVPGKVTIIDFYADWCGPCKALTPMLEDLARRDEDVYLCKIDIVKWGSQVAVQYGINAIPDVRVYNRKGRLVGEPTPDGQAIVRLVHEAK